MRLFEFSDQPWLPRVLREGETAYLTTAYRMLPLARAWVDRMVAVLQPHGSIDILDLCSGAGGPLEQLAEEFNSRGFRISIVASDLYPSSNRTRHPSIRWHPDPVDARNVPKNLIGIRTMFVAFHHFDPNAARAILDDAFRRRLAICIFEAGVGGLLGAVSMLVVPLNVLFLMPFARPFRWEYLILTYLIPVLPLMIFWDGVVSMLRTYSAAEMREMVRDLQAPEYVWEIGTVRVQTLPGTLPYLIGWPVRPE